MSSWNINNNQLILEGLIRAIPQLTERHLNIERRQENFHTEDGLKENRNVCKYK